MKVVSEKIWKKFDKKAWKEGPAEKLRFGLKNNIEVYHKYVERGDVTWILLVHFRIQW
jgi:hypothetical protein